MTDQEDIDIRLARARLRGHQMRREATLRWREAAWASVYEQRMADTTIADCDRQIARICAWLAAKGVTA